MSAGDFSGLQLVLSGLNVLVLPALVGVMRWLMKVELRLARLEWTTNEPTQKGSSHG